MSRDVKQGDRAISHKEWRKLFKKCRCKRHYEKRGSGGTDVQCLLLATPYFGRCYFSKCPKIKPDWPEEKARILDTPFGKDFPKCINENLLEGRKADEEISHA